MKCRREDAEDQEVGVITNEEGEMDDRVRREEEIEEVEGGGTSWEDSDAEVAHPVQRVKNTIDSDEEEEGSHADVIVGVDDKAPQDGANPCKFSTVLFF